MKAIALIAIFLVSILTGGLRTISKINEYSENAAQAFKQHKYQEAIVAYEYLLNNLEVNDEQIKLNLAHSYYKENRLTDALKHYRLLADSPANYIRAIVHLQLGNIATKQKKYKQALSLYKQALIANPENEAARYNFELLKKYLDQNPDKAEEPQDENLKNQPPASQDSTALPPPAEQELQPKKKPDANGEQEEEIDQPQPDEQGQQKDTGSSPTSNAQPPQQQEKEQAMGNKEGDTEGLNKENQFDPAQRERSNSSEQVSEKDKQAQMQRSRLQQANISPERAKLLLEAMRNAELQYIQQLPKKSTKKRDKSKPDW